jgi:hypothetical protein
MRNETTAPIFLSALWIPSYIGVPCNGSSRRRLKYKAISSSVDRATGDSG